MCDTIKLKLATRNDLRFLYKLKKSTLKRYIDELWGWNKHYQQNYFLKFVNSNKVFLIFCGPKKIGFVILRRFKIWNIVELIVIQPKYQRKGIGTFVMNTVISQSQKENKKVGLQVQKINESAIKFYLYLGFNLTSEFETAINMEYKSI